MTSKQPHFSLIIPAYNEHELLPRMLESVRDARHAYMGGADEIEVVVANNSSTDDTSAIAEAAGCRVVDVERRCIASARNGGADAATGKVLCFVDADSVLHEQTFNAIGEALSDRIIGGSTRVVPDRWSFGLRVSFYLTMPLLWIFDLDSGLFFVRREDFEQAGRYPEDRMYAEDVQLYLAVRRLGKTRTPRQRLVRLKGVVVETSSRKFDKHGQWHLLTNLVKYTLLRPFRKDWDQQFAKRYWYEDR